MSLIKKKHENEDLCPHCMEVIEINKTKFSYEFECPNCQEPIYWDAHLKIIKIKSNEEIPDKKNKIQKPTKKELLYIGFCFLMVLLYILVFNIFGDLISKKDEKIINQLTIIEENVLTYINNSEFEKAELEVNKMNIYTKLYRDKDVWKANIETLLRIIKEKSGNKILEEPENKKFLWFTF